MHVSDDGLHLIEGFEGFSSTPYWDPYGSVWTRGYGETEGISRGSPPITRQQGESSLRSRLEWFYEPAIAALSVQLDQNQWDALCSFAWNLGAGIFTGQLRQALQERRWAAAANLMLAYDHAGGQVLPGLQRRRQAEAQLFLRAPAPYVPADEQRWEHQYDHLRHSRAPWALARRRALRRAMLRRRRAIVRVAQQTGWKKLNRSNRYWKLWARTEP